MAILTVVTIQVVITPLPIFSRSISECGQKELSEKQDRQAVVEIENIAYGCCSAMAA
jgi:hypothetical protein